MKFIVIIKRCSLSEIKPATAMPVSAIRAMTCPPVITTAIPDRPVSHDEGSGRQRVPSREDRVNKYAVVVSKGAFAIVQQNCVNSRVILRACAYKGHEFWRNMRVNREHMIFSMFACRCTATYPTRKNIQEKLPLP